MFFKSTNIKANAFVDLIEHILKVKMMQLLAFIIFLIMTVLVISGAWVPSLLAIKIYLVIATLCAFINFSVEINR